jgi:hypothetical protein
MGSMRGGGGAGPIVGRTPFLTPAASQALGLPYAGMDPAMMGMAPPMSSPMMPSMPSAKMPRMPRMAMPKVPRVAPMMATAYTPMTSSFGRFSNNYMNRQSPTARMPTGSTLTRRATPTNAYGRPATTARPTPGGTRGFAPANQGRGRQAGRSTPPLQKPRRGLGNSTQRRRRGF